MPNDLAYSSKLELYRLTRRLLTAMISCHFTERPCDQDTSQLVYITATLYWKYLTMQILERRNLMPRLMVNTTFFYGCHFTNRSRAHGTSQFFLHHSDALLKNQTIPIYWKLIPGLMKYNTTCFIGVILPSVPVTRTLRSFSALQRRFIGKYHYPDTETAKPNV